MSKNTLAVYREKNGEFILQLESDSGAGGQRLVDPHIKVCQGSKRVAVEMPDSLSNDDMIDLVKAVAHLLFEVLR